MRTRQSPLLVVLLRGGASKTSFPFTRAIYRARVTGRRRADHEEMEVR